MDILRPSSSASFGGGGSHSPGFTAPTNSGGGGGGGEGEREKGYPGKRPRNKVPTSLRTHIVVGSTVSMVLIAIALELVLHFSQKKQGFSMGRLTTDQVQWLSGFLPTLLLFPLVWLWKQTDRNMKMLQPYVALSNGPTTAERSVLLDLEHVSFYKIVPKLYSQGYVLLLITTMITFVNVLLQPLGGALFVVKTGHEYHEAFTPIKNLNALGLNPGYKDITSFVAAAGYAQAAAFQNLTDPPFIMGNWAVGQFDFTEDVTRNRTLSVPTTGIRTNVSCSSPSANAFQLSQPTQAAPFNWTITLSLPNCKLTQSIDSRLADSQYGVFPVPQCSSENPLDPFAPIVFWFFTTQSSGATPLASAVYCEPIIQAFDVQATVDGTKGLLLNVNITGDVQENNNVTQGSFQGKAFNGISFDSPADFNLSNPFVAARAATAQTQVPGAIFRFGTDPTKGGGINNVFGSNSGFLNITEKIYTQYLSTLSLTTYFVPSTNGFNVNTTLFPNKLWMSPISTHVLAALLFTIAIVGGTIHLIHARQRRNLYLASRPGPLAHYMSLFSGQGWDANVTDMPASTDRRMSTQADILDPERDVGPLDDERRLKRKLKGVSFVFDHSGGGIAPVDGDRRRSALRSARASKQAFDMDDVHKGLLADRRASEQLPEGYHLEPLEFENRRRSNLPGINENV